ncbi:MAG TPA: hypothetical protein VLB07_15530 [Woeseiaceae bacterium]|nr:hypothetical protein [Woeseiaceae bacterium]
MSARLARCLLPVLTLAACMPAFAASRSPELEHWLDQELVPYVADQLSTHPRFRNESLQFVVMKDSNPQPVSSALALALRDRLQDALMDTPGIRIVWRPEQSLPGRIAGSGEVDCSADKVHYYIGLELTETRAGEFAFELRALDLEDRSWVAGFGKSWSGALTAAQHRAWREVATDQSFLGERDVPFTGSQTDLLAARLAHKLGCSLLQQVAGEYIATSGAGEAGETAGMIELVTNNLAAYHALRVATDGSEANATIEARAHKVDEDLYQYWVTVRPNAAASDLKAISASAYVYIEEQFNAAELVTALPPVSYTRQGAMLSGLRLVELDDVRSCSNRRDCFALQTRSNEDAIVFFLNHQLNHGLVRLAGEDCTQRATARVIRANESVNFSLLADAPGGGEWLPGEKWELSPSMDTYYVLAASDNKAARALARHVERLPLRCTASVRQGLKGGELQRWLAELETIADHWKTEIDWQLIRVRNLY